MTARVLDATAVCRVSATSTGGAFALFELALPPGAAVPPHRDPAEDEACYVVAGRVRVALGRRRAPYGPGGSPALADAVWQIARTHGVERAGRRRGP